MLIKTAVLATIGLLVSAYGYLIEQKMEKDPTYQPMCDISDKISCSKPFKSPYGKLMNMPNTIFGMGFYGAMLGLSILEYKTLLFFGALSATAASIYLAYILYAKIRTFCVLCTAVYGINLALLFSSYNYLS